MERSGRLICQSCGMPMKKDDDFGTNVDLSENKEYCCFCMKEGKFLDEGISMDDKIEELIKTSKEKLGMNEEQAREMATTFIPKLKRWNK